MSDEPTHFEVQRLTEGGDHDGHWRPVVGQPEGMTRTAARDWLNALKPTSPGKYRVVPFGFGPLQTAPADDASPEQRAAYEMLKRRVVREGGDPNEIYQFGDGYRWHAPDDHPTEPGGTLGVGWEYGRRTEKGFTVDPKTDSDVTVRKGRK